MKSLHKQPAAASLEGTIRFRFDLTPGTRDDGPSDAEFMQFVAWRRILRRLKLIGRDARLYDGYGYGNLSTRDAADTARFFITASQTSGASTITRKDIVRIDRCDARRFTIDATGALPPSSESITHAMVYAADENVKWIMHVHSHPIWVRTAALQLPATPADVAYGSPAMAAAVAALLRRCAERPLLFATLGHTDGIFACGSDAATVGGALVQILARALALP